MIMRFPAARRAFTAAALGAAALAGCSGKSGLLKSNDPTVGQMGMDRSAIEPQPDYGSDQQESFVDRAGRAAGRKVDEISNRVAGGANDYYNRAEAGVGRVADAAGRKYDQTVDQAGQAIGRAFDRTGSAIGEKIAQPAMDGIEQAGERAASAIDSLGAPPDLPDAVANPPAGSP